MSFLRRIWTKKHAGPNVFGHYDLVTPGKVSGRKSVPGHIAQPSYAPTGTPLEDIQDVDQKNQREIEGMRASCRLAARILAETADFVRAGKTTDDIDCFVHNLTVKAGAYPSPLNYRCFPKSVCTSVNNVACHGIPDDRPLINGDIINVDVTCYLHGFHGDCSRTFLIGDVDEPGRLLVRATELCLNEAIGICRPDVPFRRIGEVIQDTATKLGFNVVPCFLGHGIGAYFHGPPDIYHIKNNYPGTMETGMTFTIEPVLTQGGSTIEILDDDWTAVTADGARTAQFEHTILITDRDNEILTVV